MPVRARFRAVCVPMAPSFVVVVVVVVVVLAVLIALATRFVCRLTAADTETCETAALDGAMAFAAGAGGLVLPVLAAGAPTTARPLGPLRFVAAATRRF